MTGVQARLQRAIEVAALATATEVDEILGPRRYTELVEARRLAVHLGLATGATISQVARALKRDRATIYHHRDLIPHLEAHSPRWNGLVAYAHTLQQLQDSHA
ncbi:MAG: hypothetical protein AAGF99_00260 [Bacteroidota bacterium]